ncbi:MAG: anti-sigma factor [Gemmatimonadetes bacterium]|nr:MAG: anti-sigma factor [Gemmatimonadota bacterium]
MNSAHVGEQLSAYVDGELPPDVALEIADHLTSCAECARDYETMLTTVRLAREGLVREHAPDVLRARIRASLREETGPTVARVAPSPRRAWRIPWNVVAAALMIAVVSSGLTIVAGNRRASDSPVAQEVLASHIRSLMPEHLTDVRSNDTHNVKPWFNGRLDFSPTVPRLEEQGFPLLGGRVDYVNGRSVAVVVYGRRQHVINVFSWPAGPDGATAPSPQTKNGYNLEHWRQDGVEHWAVSDLNSAELRQFVSLLR